VNPLNTAKLNAQLSEARRQHGSLINTHLLLDTGEITTTGVRNSARGVDCIWSLSWPEQRAIRVNPIVINAFYGSGFHHPHLRGGTVGDWPLNVFTQAQAAEELSTLRAIAAVELHNLVFQSDYRVVPATKSGQS
jgi:hypothetical protein